MHSLGRQPVQGGGRDLSPVSAQVVGAQGVDAHQQHVGRGARGDAAPAAEKEKEERSRDQDEPGKEIEPESASLHCRILAKDADSLVERGSESGGIAALRLDGWWNWPHESCFFRTILRPVPFMVH